jgi:glucose-1-phosphate adenylyltransferase
LAAEQTYHSDDWYQGTADAVRKNLKHFADQDADYYIILSGDQLYRMDYQEMLKTHIESGAVLTIAAKTISREEATGLGIIGADENGIIKKFYEKPAPDLDIGEYRIQTKLLKRTLNQKPCEKNEYLASMGIYIFDADVMHDLLEGSTSTDFGKEVIPEVIKTKKVAAYVFDGFWEDIGTIKAFYDTNLDLSSVTPAFDFYNEEMPIYTHRRHLPATKVNFCNISTSLTSEGSIITNAYIVNSIIGVRTLIESGASLDGVYCMGASYYETPEEKIENARKKIPNIGIGRATIIRRAIIDQNARIGDNCRIGIDDIERAEGDYANYSIHDGIIVIHKNAIIPHGTIL